MQNILSASIQTSSEGQNLQTMQYVNKQ